MPLLKNRPIWDVNNVCTLNWRHNDHDGVSNHKPHGCLLNRLFRRKSKKTSKLRVTGLCVGNSPGPVNSPHKGPVTRKTFPFDDVIMKRGPGTHGEWSLYCGVSDQKTQNLLMFLFVIFLWSLVPRKCSRTYENAVIYSERGYKLSLAKLVCPISGGIKWPTIPSRCQIMGKRTIMRHWYIIIPVIQRIKATQSVRCQQRAFVV